MSTPTLLAMLGAAGLFLGASVFCMVRMLHEVMEGCPVHRAVLVFVLLPLGAGGIVAAVVWGFMEAFRP